MTKLEMLHTVQTQLATDLNCTPDELNGEKDSFVFTEAKDNPGRRPLPRGEQHFAMLSMGKAIVISATSAISSTVADTHRAFSKVSFPDYFKKTLHKPIVERYYQTLVDEGVTGYSWENCVHDYKMSVASMVLIPVWQYSVFGLDYYEIGEMINE